MRRCFKRIESANRRRGKGCRISAGNHAPRARVCNSARGRGSCSNIPESQAKGTPGCRRFKLGDNRRQVRRLLYRFRWRGSARQVLNSCRRGGSLSRGTRAARRDVFSRRRVSCDWCCGFFADSLDDRPCRSCRLRIGHGLNSLRWSCRLHRRPRLHSRLQLHRLHTLHT